MSAVFLLFYSPAFVGLITAQLLSYPGKARSNDDMT